MFKMPAASDDMDLFFNTKQASMHNLRHIIPAPVSSALMCSWSLIAFGSRWRPSAVGSDIVPPHFAYSIVSAESSVLVSRTSRSGRVKSDTEDSAAFIFSQVLTRLPSGSPRATSKGLVTSGRS